MEFIYQNKKIFYRIFGKGKPVILLHGFGEDGEIWNNQVNHLKEKYHLIVPDLPGSGKSEMINDMSMSGMADMVEALLSQETKMQVAMIGHSMGGYITLAFAEKYPSRLSAFGLFHSTAYADPEEKKATRKKAIRFIEEHGPKEFLQTTIPNLFGPGSKSLVPGFLKALPNFSAAALVSYYEAMMARPDRTAVLSNVKIPILFIFGEHDTAVSISDGLKQCHLPEMSYIHILNDSGHMGMIEETDKSNRILDEFLLVI